MKAMQHHKGVFLGRLSNIFQGSFYQKKKNCPKYASNLRDVLHRFLVLYMYCFKCPTQCKQQKKLRNSRSQMAFKIGEGLQLY